MNTNENKSPDNEEPTLIEYAKMHLDHDRLERASICAMIAQEQAAERQAAALERIAAVLESVKGQAWGGEGSTMLDCLFVATPRV